MVIIGDDIDADLNLELRARHTETKSVDNFLEAITRYSLSNCVPLIDPTLYRTII